MGLKGFISVNHLLGLFNRFTGQIGHLIAGGTCKQSPEQGEPEHHKQDNENTGNTGGYADKNLFFFFSEALS